MRPGSTPVPAFGGKALSFLAALILAASCGPLARYDAVPVEVEPRAGILNMRDIRFWGDGDPAQLDAMAAAGNAALGREMAYLAAGGHQGPLPPVHALAIS